MEMSNIIKFVNSNSLYVKTWISVSYWLIVLLVHVTTGSAVVRVSIKDVNDNEPYFEKEFYKAEVREDSFTGQSIITIAAKDADGEYLAAV